MTTTCWPVCGRCSTLEVAAGNQHTPEHWFPGLWQLLVRLAPEHQLLLRGYANFCNEAVTRGVEQRHQALAGQAAPEKRAIERLHSRLGLAEIYGEAAAWE
jgi:hypothetical protein